MNLLKQMPHRTHHTELSTAITLINERTSERNCSLLADETASNCITESYTRYDDDDDDDDSELL